MLLITMSDECHHRRLLGFMSACICSLRTATVQFWPEEPGATMLGAEVPRLGCGVTSNAELLEKRPGPDSVPRKRENPKGEKAKHTKNKCKWTEPAKAPL